MFVNMMGIHAGLEMSCKELAHPFCDASLPIPERVRDLLERLNTSQRIAQTAMVGPAVPELAMEQYNYGGEALHGLWSTCVVDNLTASSSNRTVCPTQFPSPISLGASFSRSLWRAVGDATSTAARALYAYNKLLPPTTAPARSLEGPIGLTFYAPNVNLVRDPRWGRIEAVPSEDPVMNGEYGAAFVTGFQNGEGALPSHAPYIKAAAVVKHFAAYSLEYDFDSKTDRHAFDAIVTKQDMVESFTPAFEMATSAGVAAVMCSYNAINGECASWNRAGGPWASRCPAAVPLAEPLLGSLGSRMDSAWIPDGQACMHGRVALGRAAQALVWI